MKKLLNFLIFLPTLVCAQNYIESADSCFSIKDYACAGINYDLFLTKVENKSNNIAYRSALSWSLAKDKEKAFVALNLYVRNNNLNNYFFFSEQLLKEKSFLLLKSDTRWDQIIADVKKSEDQIRQKEKRKVDSAVTFQTSLEKFQMRKWASGIKLKEAKYIYNRIKKYNSFPTIRVRNISLQFKITDSVRMAFLVVLPPNYDSKKSYSLLFFLHGAVSSNTGYIDFADDWDTKGWNRYYTKYASQVIMVYPHGNKDYNWMYPDAGFFMVPSILKQVKNIFNIDDNRVFISGHSNGATGSFSYLMKQPSPYAAFYGFNTRPRVATGGTFIKNILNRSYFNVSTDKDYYYPPSANDSLKAIMKIIGAEYQDHRYNGFPHWFPQFDESEPAYKLLFNDIAKKIRKPFQSNIYWECDDIKYGNCDWVTITALDTIGKRAEWHKNINYKITKWVVLDKKDSAIVRDTLLNAYNYRHRSGAIQAKYNDNVFRVETSDIKSFSILISPEMIDIHKPVTIIVNGKIYKRLKLGYDNKFMLANFKKTLDRKAIWINQVTVNL